MFNFAKTLPKIFISSKLTSFWIFFSLRFIANLFPIPFIGRQNIVFPVAFIRRAIKIGHGSLTMSFIIVPFTSVDCSIGPRVSAMPLFLFVYIVALIDIAIYLHVLTFAVAFFFLEFSYVYISGNPNVDAPTMPFTILEVSNVIISIIIPVLAVSLQIKVPVLKHVPLVYGYFAKNEHL